MHQGARLTRCLRITGVTLLIHAVLLSLLLSLLAKAGQIGSKVNLMPHTL